MPRESKRTIVILEMQPSSPRATRGGFFRICDSGYGAGLRRAEQELNSAIIESEAGRRDLVELHRLRAKCVYSKATSLKPIEAALACVYSNLGDEMTLPKNGFFDVSQKAAIEAIETGLKEYSKKLDYKKKRQASAKKARQKLDSKKRELEPLIEDVIRNSGPHPEGLRDALDGLDGKQIKSWAEKQLQKAKERADKRISESRRCRELTVERSKPVELDVMALRELQEEIDALDEGQFVLTEGEENLLFDLEFDAEEIYDVVRKWRDELPEELREFASIVEDEIRCGCPFAGSFESLVRRILIDEWDERDDFDDWLG